MRRLSSQQKDASRSYIRVVYITPSLAQMTLPHPIGKDPSRLFKDQSKSLIDFLPVNSQIFFAMRFGPFGPARRGFASCRSNVLRRATSPKPCPMARSMQWYGDISGIEKRLTELGMR